MIITIPMILCGALLAAGYYVIYAATKCGDKARQDEKDFLAAQTVEVTEESGEVTLITRSQDEKEKV